MLRFWRHIAILAATGCTTALPAPSTVNEREGAAEEMEIVAVDWLGRGQRWAARVVARRDGFTSVEYADGEREWVESARLGPVPDLNGTTIQVWSRNGPREVTVIEQRGPLYHVRRADGGELWVDGRSLYTLDVAADEAEPQQEQRVFARRRPVDPASVTVGARVLAYWMDENAPRLGQPRLAQVSAVQNGRADVLFANNEQASIPIDAVIHVFAANVGRLRVGEHVWITDGRVGLVLELDRRFVKFGNPQQVMWIEATEVVGRSPPVQHERVVVGAHVTTAWGTGAPWHGTVVSRAGDQVTLQWHDGSSPSAVSIAQIVDVWEAMTPATLPDP